MTADERRALIYKDGLDVKEAVRRSADTQTDICSKCCGFKGATSKGKFCGECGGFGSIIRLHPRFR